MLFSMLAPFLPPGSRICIKAFLRLTNIFGKRFPLSNRSLSAYSITENIPWILGNFVAPYAKSLSIPHLRVVFWYLQMERKFKTLPSYFKKVSISYVNIKKKCENKFNQFHVLTTLVNANFVFAFLIV